MPSNSGTRRLPSSLLAIVTSLLACVLLTGATEINIGVNNTVNTGKIVGGDCLQGNNKLTTRPYPVGAFERIAVDGVFTVKVTCGSKEAVAITADDNLHKLIVAEVKNGTFHLGSTGSYCTSNSFVAEISLPTLRAIAADGSSELALSCGKSGKGGQIDIRLGGASTMTASGQTGKLQVTVAESSELDAYELVAETVQIKASDAATARVTATRSLAGKAEAASSVAYRGRPKHVEVVTEDASECSPDE